MNTATPAPRYRKAFPDFTLDVAIPNGFEDVSYRQDACPAWINGRAGLHLFIDYADPDQRETVGPRFVLSEYGPDGIGAVVIEADDYAAILTHTTGMEVKS